MNDRPRVLRVIGRLNIGGPARQAVFLNHALPQRGFDAHLISGSEAPGEGRIDPGPERVTVIASMRREIRLVDDLAAFRSIDRFVSAWRPDVVHTHQAKAGALARVAGSRRRVPAMVHTFHGHVLEGYFSRPASRVFIEVERRLAKRTHALVAVSLAIRDELLELGIGRPSQWHVVPVGVVLDSLLETRHSPQQARVSLGLPVGGPLVGIVGRLVPIKDHATFLAAAARIVARRPDVKFVVAGDGELHARLKQRAIATLGDRVRFLGWVDDLESLFAALDLVVLTSRNEGTPVSLIEAGAMGRAVVATCVGGVADVVDDGRTGILVPVGDPDAVAVAVGSLLDNMARRDAMGAAAREYVRGRFSTEALLDHLTDLYHDLLSQKGQR
jgi:glycosyltransferase involved in cell wall biosynthesis